jgi:hypothetical protein
MPGMALEIEGAMQQAAQPLRQITVVAWQEAPAARKLQSGKSTVLS